MTVWASFMAGGTPDHRVGIVVDDEIRALEAGVSMLDLLHDAALEDAASRVTRRPAETFSIADIRLLPPVPTPPSVRDFMAFEQHVDAGYSAQGADVPDLFFEIPVFYFTNPRALVGANDDIPVPPGCEKFDYELEIAAILGREGGDLTPGEAEKHVAGYCIYVDWSARDLQRREMQMRLGPAKGKDSSTTLGPYLVTPDEIESARSGKAFDLGMTVSVNDQVRGEDRWSSIEWSFGEMLAWASRGTVLSVGDVVGTGTCGHGCIAEMQFRYDADEYPWLQPGDRVRMEVEGLGVTENTVVTGRAPVAHRQSE